LCWRRSFTAFNNILDLSGNVVEDQAGNAFLAELMAASMSCGVDVWIVQVGVAVEGSIDWKVFEPLEGVGWAEPE
jgi:predicted metal-dependent peptidase